MIQKDQVIMKCWEVWKKREEVEGHGGIGKGESRLQEQSIKDSFYT